MSDNFLIQPTERVIIIVGPYGSGKSEISVNLALHYNKRQFAVSLYDLDIINPFFRSSDARALLTSRGITVVSSVFAGTNIDVPAVPGAVQTIFTDNEQIKILDIGGEDMGARVVASLKDRWASLAKEPAVWMVINPLRPFMETVDEICAQAASLSAAAGLKITGLIHNANLMGLKSATVLTEHRALIDQAAARLSLPVVFAAALAENIPQHWSYYTPDGLPLLRMVRTIV